MMRHPLHFGHRKPRKKLSKVYILPNLFTAMNLLLGLLACYAVLSGDLQRACWFVVLAGVLDGLDGAVARLTHTESDFGVEFDSLSDLVSFGIAPSFIAFALMRNIGEEHDRLVTGVCAIFSICAALRLARYNVQHHGSERSGFEGLPSPGAALALIFSVLLIIEYGLMKSELVLLPLGKSSLTMGKLVTTSLPFIVLFMALLMVSRVPYLKVTKHIHISRRMSFESLVSIILIAGLVMAAQSDMRVLFGFGLFATYLIHGLIRFAFQMARPSHSENNEEEMDEDKESDQPYSA
ncbi:MAG: CDP-diacylglycerol--serine O-phosphatidyltransferase [Candidatus Sumerlaeia bacterium]